MGEETRDYELGARERELQSATAEKEHRELKLKLRDQKTALYAVIATAIVGVIGSLTTLGVSRLQSSDEAERSAENFKRDQRVAAYSEYLSAVDAFIVAQDELEMSLVDCKQRKWVTSFPTYWDYQKAFQTVSSKSNVVAIVGSDSTSNVATQLDNAVSSVRQQVFASCKGLYETPDNIELMNRVFRYRDTLLPAQAEFKKAARADLQAN